MALHRIDFSRRQRGQSNRLACKSCGVCEFLSCQAENSAEDQQRSRIVLECSGKIVLRHCLESIRGSMCGVVDVQEVPLLVEGCFMDVRKIRCQEIGRASCRERV